MAEKPVFGSLNPSDFERGHRDAFHIPAILCMVKSGPLRAGQSVDIESNGNSPYVVGLAGGVGIVDPFLRSLAFAGSLVWVLIRPEFAGNVRHHFQIKGVDEPAKQEVSLSPAVMSSIAANPESIPASPSLVSDEDNWEDYDDCCPPEDEYDECRGCY